MKVGFIGLGIIGCPIDAERGRAGLPASGRGKPILRVGLDGAAEGGVSHELSSALAQIVTCPRSSTASRDST